MTRPLALYVSIPFCTSKCHFCDWVQSIPKSELLLREGDPQRVDYVAALCVQIEQLGRRLLEEGGYAPKLMYWGGGTASILDPSEIKKIADAMASVFDLGALEEATIECSPETLTLDKLRLFREVGFTRFSSGVQSFDDERLRRIGRSHRAQQAEEAVYMAREAGFEEISIDIICGYPGETLDEVERTLDRALRLPLTHMSYYPFRPSVGTIMRHQLSRGRSLIDPAEQKQAYALGRERLGAAGLKEYSSAHFGKPCGYDLSMFQLRMDWAGFGSGAHSLLKGQVLASQPGILGQYNQHPTRWQSRVPAASQHMAPLFIWQAMMTFEGISRRVWKERSGVELEQTLQLPDIQRMFDFFRSKTEVIEDEEGVRLPSHEIPNVAIDWFYEVSPQEGRAPLAEPMAM